MPPPRSSAVVLGASMSGSLVARALSGHFERVTLVQRDVLPPGEEAAKASHDRPMRMDCSRAGTPRDGYPRLATALLTYRHGRLKRSLAIGPLVPRYG
jgi:hypothetical protein